MSVVELLVLCAAVILAYGLRMAAGASVVKANSQAQFNWTKKRPRRGLLAVGRNAFSSGLMERINWKTITKVSSSFIWAEISSV